MNHRSPLPTRLAAVALLALPVVSAQGNVLRVDPTDPGAFAEIQDAVDAARPGQQIVVADGIYGPVLVATDGLTIRAKGGADPIVDAAGALEAIKIVSSNVTLVGLTARNGTGPTNESGEGILIDGGRNNRVVRCTAYDNTSGGISLTNGSHHVVLDCEAYGNTIGIIISTFDGVTSASDCLVARCYSHDNAFDGMQNFIPAATRNSFVGNLIANNPRLGIFVTECSDVTVRNNLIVDNGIDGINSSFTSGLKILGNTIIGHARYGYAIRETTDSIVAFNRVERSGLSGFSINDFTSQGGPGPSIRNVFAFNASLDNGEYGFFLDPSSTENRFFVNRFSGNALGDSNIPLGN